MGDEVKVRGVIMRTALTRVVSTVAAPPASLHMIPPHPIYYPIPPIIRLHLQQPLPPTAACSNTNRIRLPPYQYQPLSATTTSSWKKPVITEEEQLKQLQPFSWLVPCGEEQGKRKKISEKDLGKVETHSSI
jgi:hypothetical protein